MARPFRFRRVDIGCGRWRSGLRPQLENALRIRSLLHPLCRLIGHRRSGRRAYVDPLERRWRSYCRRCNAPLRKEGLLGWKVCSD